MQSRPPAVSRASFGSLSVPRLERASLFAAAFFAVLFLPRAMPALDDAADAIELLETGEYESARDAFVEVLKTSPDDAAARRGLARALAATGEYDAALAALRQGPSFEKSADLRAAAGRILQRTGKLAEAEAEYRAALAADPDHVESLNRLGEVLSLTGRREDAEKQWNRVIRVYQEMSIDEAEKSPAEVFVEMGVALRHLNRYHDANDVMFPQAREQDEDSLPLLVEWSRTYLEKYDFPFSRDLLRRALDRNRNDADALVLLAENYLVDFQVGTERYSLAEKQLERAIEVNEHHPGAWRALGSLWLTDGDLDRAEKDLLKSLEIDPTDSETLGLLAACYNLQGGAEERFADMERRALEVNPKNAVFFHTIAKAIESRFRYQEAARMAERALELDPDYWQAYPTLGTNYLRTGEIEKGRKYLERAFEKDPFNVWVLNTRKLLRYMDSNHREYRTDRFVFHFPTADFDVLKTYLVPVLEKAWDNYSRYYETELEKPIYIDVFSKHQWFSARIVGLGGVPASGACFGNVVALTTPKALPQNWGAVAVHEFAHVFTLHATDNRVPRWLTEGLSVFEEGRDHPRWKRNFTREIADAWGSGRLLPIAELDSGFSKPKYPLQVLISYFQGCLVVEYVRLTWGFDKVLELLDGYREKKSTEQIFREVFGKSTAEFDEGFFAWLDRWVKENGYTPALAEDRMLELEIEVEEHPDDLDRLADLAWAYVTNQNDIDAPITARKVLEKNPDHADAHAVLGFCLAGEKKKDEAKKELERALELGTKFRYRVHEALGALAQESGDKAKAIEHFEKAKEIAPLAGAAYPQGGGNLYYRLAALYDEEGRSEDAVRVLEELRLCAVEDAKCRLDLLARYEKDDSDEAAKKSLEILDEILYLNPFDTKLHERLAGLAERLGEYRTVVREYGYLETLPDTNPKKAWLALAKAWLALGEHKEAAEYARKVLEIDPGHSEAKEIVEKAS